MLLSRTLTLLDRAFTRPGSVLVLLRVIGPTGETLTARAGCTFQRHRLLSGSGLERAHLGKPEPGALDRGTSAGFITSDWGHLNRVGYVARSLSGLSMTRHSCGGDAKNQKDVFLFTGNTTSTLSRAAATNTATKKNEDKRDLQEASRTSSTEESQADKPEPEEGKPNKTQQLKKVFKEYGAVGVSFHIGISLMSLGMFYLLISSGIDVAALLCKLGFNESVVQSKMAAGTSTFVLAYAIHKLFAPVRISITLVSVPLIVRYFRKTGLFKPPTPAP
uniref:Family with sequence similarity 210, member B n=1 Tax=Iconisemion striatum TaxID=60296 RepID=A0A1A7Z637_9TELE